MLTYLVSRGIDICYKIIKHQTFSFISKVLDLKASRFSNVI